MTTVLQPVKISRGEFLTCDTGSHRVAQVSRPIHTLDSNGELLAPGALVFLDATGKPSADGLPPAGMQCPKCGGVWLTVGPVRLPSLTYSCSVHTERRGWVS